MPGRPLSDGKKRLNWERMELRSTKPNHARRNLFGAVDHELLQQDFQSMLYANTERASWRWNFDFFQDTPTEGLLQWEELPSHEVPTFYHPCVVWKTCKPIYQDVGKESKMHYTVEILEKHLPVQKKANKKSLAGKKQKQTSLTDNFRTKRKIRMDMQTPVKKTALGNGAS